MAWPFSLNYDGSVHKSDPPPPPLTIPLTFVVFRPGESSSRQTMREQECAGRSVALTGLIYRALREKKRPYLEIRLTRLNRAKFAEFAPRRATTKSVRLTIAERYCDRSLRRFFNFTLFHHLITRSSRAKARALILKSDTISVELHLNL